MYGGIMLQTNPEPLSETSLLILLSLLPRPSHGYAILKEVQHLSEQRVRLSTGTLYGALKRMIEQGLVIRSDAESDDSRVTHLYTLTESGRHVLQVEAARMRKLSALVEQGLTGETIAP